MNLSGEAIKLKITVGENDIIYQRPLYEAIVYAAKKYKISGVTVVKGIMSYGSNSMNQSIKVFALAADLPIIIEMVDKRDRLTDFAAIVSRLMDKAGAGGLITLEEVNVLHYGTGIKTLETN
jgi:PII-like signaling protein